MAPDHHVRTRVAQQPVTDAASPLARLAGKIRGADPDFRRRQRAQQRRKLGDLGVATWRVGNTARRCDHVGQ